MNKGSLRLFVIAGCTTLAACGMQGDAEKVVRATLTDPDSARFGNFYYNAKTKKGCLAVNSKNSMGGYSGEQQAYVKLTPNGWEHEGTAALPLDSCKRVFADAVY